MGLKDFSKHASKINRHLQFEFLMTVTALRENPVFTDFQIEREFWQWFRNNSTVPVKLLQVLLSTKPS